MAVALARFPAALVPEQQQQEQHHSVSLRHQQKSIRPWLLRWLTLQLCLDLKEQKQQQQTAAIHHLPVGP
jgi:hypothetical protein